MTNDTVFIPFGQQILALTRDEFAQALLRGQQLESAPKNHQVLTADQLEVITGIPSQWFGMAAREGRIPCLRFGKYVRFELEPTLEAARGAREGVQSTLTKGAKSDQGIWNPRLAIKG